MEKRDVLTQEEKNFLIDKRIKSGMSKRLASEFLDKELEILQKNYNTKEFNERIIAIPYGG